MAYSIQDLEAEVLTAVRALFARYEAANGSPPANSADPGAVRIIGSVAEPDGLSHHWPDRAEPTPYDHVVRHTVQWEGRQYELMIGYEHGGRFAYGKSRGRIVVFLVTGSGTYPLVEFTRTDETQPTFSSVIPKPGATGRTQANVDDIDIVRQTPYLALADVRHVGEVFKDKSAGTTLRLVCDENDALMMATHALNVGRHRRKL